MTKAMRWGFSALMTVGCMGLGSVVGCSEDEDPVTSDPDTGTVSLDTGMPPTDTGSPMDTGTPSETSTEGGMDADAGKFQANRGITVVFGAPDFGNKYICVGGFAGDPAAAMAPAEALGPPAGIPDSTAPTDPMKFKPFPYGAVVPFPLSKLAQDFLDTPLTAVLYLVDTNTKDCKAAWADVKGDATRWVAVPGKTIKSGEQYLVRIHGCKDPTTTGTAFPGSCGSATAPAPLKLDYKKLDNATPATFTGTMGPKVGVQFVHMSPFPGVTGAVPSFQDVDVYLQPMAAPAAGDAGADGGEGGTDGGGMATPAGTPIKIASGLKYGDVAPSAVGVQLAGDPTEAFMVITPKDVAPCSPGATCTSVWLPLKAFLAAYKPTGGGFTDGTNQFFGLTGSPVPNAAMMRSILIPIGMMGKTGMFPSSG
jgi:hypothetical protein